MISYLKAERSFSDAFIAGMRGVCVISGLIGTVAMPWLEKRLGLARAGAWSLWYVRNEAYFICTYSIDNRSQILSLVPVVVSLYVGLGNCGTHGPSWNAVMLFGGMALSRIGLWSFDLVQLQILQESLANHARRNALTALQLSLQNMFDLTKYALVLGLNKPSQFKWTALVSWISVFTGVSCSYIVQAAPK
jgi:iron-regulated transporter 1